MNIRKVCIYMKTKKVSLKINDIRPGMRLAEEIRYNNLLILPSGSLITQILLDRLRDRYFQQVITVYCDEDVTKKDSNEINEEKTIEKIRKNFNKISQDIEHAFNNINSATMIDIKEVRNFASKIQDYLYSPSNVVKNIVLHGSGDDAIYKHSANVAALSSLLGKWIGLDEKEINLLTYAAILHDLGKTKIDKNILNKVEALTNKEISKLKSHPTIGYDFVKNVPYLHSSVSFGILMHHERMDGSGYPMGLKGPRIHQFGKIIAIADVFDAVNSNRVYKKRKDPFKALDTIQKESLLKLDYEYSKIFIEHIMTYYIGEKVLLSDGRIGQILQININNLSSPLIVCNNDFIDLNLEKKLRIENLVE